MFDGIKVLAVSVDVDELLTNDRLTFGGLVDTQTGFVLDRVRKAHDRGLTLRIVPRQTGQGFRVEVKGSLHRFCNNGLHNADQYTVNDLLLTLDEWVNVYGFDLFNSVINNIEFGVNLELSFPVSQVLKNLICYKNQPFDTDSKSQVSYHVCNLQRYAVKLYDKGKQKGLGDNLLRFEIRVKKMEYFNGTGVQLRTLADLMNVANYEPLGALLIDTFNNILFDDPAINPESLTIQQREMYHQCRNPRYWTTSDNRTLQRATSRTRDRHRQRLSRNKDRFRALLNQYGTNWPGEVTALIGQTWARLTAVDADLLARIDQHKTAWLSGGTCHELTDFSPATCHKLTDLSTPNLSQINPLYSGVHCDSVELGESTGERVFCPITGVPIPDQSKPGVRRFVSAVMLRSNDDLLMSLSPQFRQYGKGSKEDPFSRVAHNIRNRHSNPRNNLRRRLTRLNQNPTLFDVSDTLRLTPDQRAALDYWKGTPYEVRI